MVLTPHDDYPVHQTAAPLAHPATGDLNHYDRYFFNGYDAEAGVFLAAALGVYPNRQVIDAAVSVIVDGRQRSVYASGRVPLDRTRTEVGPLRVEVIEPFRRFRVVADAPDHGVEVDATFEARTPVLEEPRFRRDAHATRAVMDYTRLVQWGSWSGRIGGDTPVELRPDRVLGCRDRSWGIRRTGEPEPGPAPGQPQFFWLWAPLNFPDGARHVAFNDTADGRPWYEAGAVVPLLGDGPTFGPDAEPERMRAVDVDVTWAAGTRRAEQATLTLHPWRDEPEVIELEPVLLFQMKGIGYGHPTWRHGSWHGDGPEVGSDSWRPDDLDPERADHVHVQAVVRARRGDGVEGTGVLEQLVIGPHQPTGLTGLVEGYRA